MDDKIKIIGFAGSLRKGSFNAAILSAAKELAPADADIETLSLEGIPPYNNDMEGNIPETVRQFKSKIKAADAILISTPEYNYSIPGVLKNAIDWASRPHGDNSFEGKPVAIMGASTGMLGTARAQYHLRQTFVYLNMRPLNRPEVFVTFAADKIDQTGRLKDEKTRDLIKKLLEELVSYARKLKS
jgi:chromate reductase